VIDDDEAFIHFITFILVAATKVDNNRNYICGGNALWTSLFWTPCKGVPVNRQAATASGIMNNSN
jgi:hypothetical protein